MALGRASVFAADDLPSLRRRRTLLVQSAERPLHVGRIPDTLDGADPLEIGAAKRKSLAPRRRVRILRMKEA